MKSVMRVMIGSVLGFVVAVGTHATEANVAVDTTDTSVIERYMAEASMLEQAIGEVATRIESIERRTYKDPKGYRRASLNRMLRTKQEKLDSLNQRIAELNGSRDSAPTTDDNSVVAPGSS